MALYTYKCTACGKPDELLRKYDERDLPEKCSVCNGNLSRSAVELFAICKKLGDGVAPQRRRGGTGIRIEPGVKDTQLSRCIFNGLGTGVEAAEDSSFTSRGDRFINCDVAYDINDAEYDIRDTEIE